MAVSTPREKAARRLLAAAESYDGCAPDCGAGGICHQAILDHVALYREEVRKENQKSRRPTP